jgi:predicted flap endonuclease-1-like 5' DNA nuclease
MAKLEAIEGIGETYAQQLRDAGIGSTGALLEKGATSKKTGISEKLILEWVNHTDLFRVKGVGEEYADLLEEAGVDTVPELAQRKPENLYKKLLEVNQAKELVRRPPSQAEVSSWVKQAKKLDRVVTY